MTFAAALVNSLRSPLPPVTRLGAISGHLRLPGPRQINGHFILTWAQATISSHRLSQSGVNLVMICVGKNFVKILLHICLFQAILRISIFFQIFYLDFFGLGLDLHRGLGELLEVPPAACDPPGCQKWPFEAAWAISFWPGPRQLPG